MPTIGARWPRILAEQLVTVPEPILVALEPSGEAPPRAVIQTAARAMLDGQTLGTPQQWPAWLAPHQIPAAERLTAILARYRGALLADDVGLGKSYVALAVALNRRGPFTLVVPAVLVAQWRALLERFGVVDITIITHETLSQATAHFSVCAPNHLVIVDEAHRFRNPETKRYRALARLVVVGRVLLLTATPIHNTVGDLFHLLRLFLRDHAFAALGIPSLHHAARDGGNASAAARVVVARSRERIRAAYPGGPVALTFPRLEGMETVRVGPAPDAVLSRLISAIQRLRSGGPAAPLLRLVLLRRLASSLPAFRASLLRHEAYLDLSARAAAQGRGLSPREFQLCFPRAAESDVQLVLFPLILEAGSTRDAEGDRRTLRELRETLPGVTDPDPKADALSAVLSKRRIKTIVFSDAHQTVRYLLRRLGALRAAAVFGSGGRFASGTATRREILRAFAPRAQNGTAVPPALRTDLLIATDLLSEGLNLQDAERVVHYDLPWSPARMAQRVGRIDRLGSAHATVTTVTFLPPEPLARALEMEERLAAKVSAQSAGGAQGELDWCDRLVQLRGDSGAASPACAAVAGDRNATVLIVRIGELMEAIVVEDGVARTGPAAATRILSAAWSAAAVPMDSTVLRDALVTAAPLITARLAAVQDARWRASDRDRFARRLIPWVLSAARRAARRGNADQLRSLDGLVSRLALGMTSGEELLLEDLLTDRKPLAVHDMLAWHHRLPPISNDEPQHTIALIAAVVMQTPAS